MTCSARWRWWRRRITAVQKRLGVGPWYTFGAALKTLVFIYIARPPRRVGCGSAGASIAVGRMGQPPGLPRWPCGPLVFITNRCRAGRFGLPNHQVVPPSGLAPKPWAGQSRWAMPAQIGGLRWPVYCVLKWRSRAVSVRSVSAVIPACSPSSREGWPPRTAYRATTPWWTPGAGEALNPGGRANQIAGTAALGEPGLAVLQPAPPRPSFEKIPGSPHPRCNLQTL